jgi:hypothetical protein
VTHITESASCRNNEVIQNWNFVPFWPSQFVSRAWFWRFNTDSGFQQTYRICTPAADIRRYMEEGAKIARVITARYAN